VCVCTSTNAVSRRESISRYTPPARPPDHLTRPYLPTTHHPVAAAASRSPVLVPVRTCRRAQAWRRPAADNTPRQTTKHAHNPTASYARQPRFSEEVSPYPQQTAATRPAATPQRRHTDYRMTSELTLLGEPRYLGGGRRLSLAFTRYSFTLRGSCALINHPLTPLPLVLSTLLQYYCTTIAQYRTYPPTPPLHAIHFAILVIAISCKG